MASVKTVISLQKPLFDQVEALGEKISTLSAQRIREILAGMRLLTEPRAELIKD